MKSRNWFLIGLLLLLGAALLFREDGRRRQRDAAAAGTNAAPRPAGSFWDRLTRRAPAPAPGPARAAAPSTAHVTALSTDPRLPFRVRNTTKPDAELFRSETALLLRNALVETREPVRLNIPGHLRAQGDPGSYLVQARGGIDQQFRDVLRGAGAEVVSYVPNNAYLIRAGVNTAQQLRLSPRVEQVLPFEPFYKLDMALLPLAVRQEPMPAGRWLNLVLFRGTSDRAKADLAALGVEVKAEQPFPFGHVLTVAPPADTLVALAQLPAVQNIEAYHSPVLMNDLSRVRLDVSTDTTLAAPGGNWLGLTGNGVVVGHVDSGMDLAHPQLAGRFFTNAASPTADLGPPTNAPSGSGHGTAVAGVIVANDSTTPTPTNGSIAGAYYRGIASGAQLYPLSLYSTEYTNVGLHVNANVWLITNAALATNTLAVVNNSWGYPVNTYGVNSALYDEAVRDALPFRTNSQPITHVFAAGNLGGGNSGGLGGAADTIAEPGNAKNVITVGASELLRLVPNSLIATNTGTNDPQATAHSDNYNHVADFSGRGNVGVGIEGTAGRFKPDLVAPGAYVVTLRASTFTNLQETDAQNMLGSSQWRYESGTSLAAGKVSGLLALMQEFFRVNHGRTNGLRPSLNKALLINRARTLGPAYDFAVNASVAHQGWGIPSLSNTLPTATAFRFLTSTSSPAAGGSIVLLEESALLTNRLASGQYNAFDVAVPAIAGSLTNTLKITLAWTDPPGNPVASTKLVNDLDLYVTNVLANGAVVPNGAQYEGNNIASGSLVTQPTSPGAVAQRDSVNNVESIYIPITNTINGVDAVSTTFRVYVIGRKINVNAVTAETNQVVQDYSMVFSTDRPGQTITVTPRPMPNAIPFFAYTNRAINQVTNGLPYLNERVGANSPLFTANGIGNVNTNGVTNQWNFYVFTNVALASPTITTTNTNIIAGVTNITTNVITLPSVTNAGPYVAFSTFLPPNLARARNAEADIDLFVARSGGPTPVPNPHNLTNLDPAVLSHPNLFRSTNRGGKELFSITNSFIGEYFYVGIKSEDQQGGSYGFFGASSQTPFATNNTNGQLVITLFPVPAAIPDGTPEAPGGVTLYGILPTNVTMRSLSMSNTIVHENVGDLVGTLTHNSTVVTLFNHTVGTGTNPPGGLTTNNLVYDDFRNPPDGPGDVTDFLGQDAVGLWIFEVYDNSPFLTGSVDYASIYIVPFTNQYRTNGSNVYYRTVTLAAGQSTTDFFDVPSYATNLDVDIIGGLAGVVGPTAGNGVDLFANAPGLGVPTGTNTNGFSRVTLDLDNLDTTFPHLNISPTTVAPLTPGRWNFRILNNSASQLTLDLRYTLGVDLAVTDTAFNFTNAAIPLLDDYTTNLFLSIPVDRVIQSVDVGLSILHPRISDLVITLFSPSGKKALLFEDRAGTNGVTNANLRANFTENPAYVTYVDTNGSTAFGQINLDRLLPIKFVPAPFSAVISPPSLVTNMTNLLFGHTALPRSPHESPGSIAHFGNVIFVAGKVGRDDGNPGTPFRSTNDGFIVSYATPINTNRYTLFTNATTVTTNVVFDPITNWHVTNFWAGSLSGYRGGNPNLAGSLPDQTYFAGLAVNSNGVFAAGPTRNYFPPTSLTWSGTNSNHVYDIDLGATAGSVSLTHLSDTLRDRILVEYQGLPLMDLTPAAGAAPTNFTTNLLFHGASRFLRVTMNPVAPAAVGSTWTNSLTIYRSNGVTFAVTNFVAGSFMLPPATPAFAAPSPLTLSNPQAVALDVSNDVYVADTGNSRILKFRQSLSMANNGVAVAGVVGTNATYVPFTNNASGDPAPRNVLLNPAGIAVHTNGDIYVADTGNHLVKRFTSSGTWVETWGDSTGGTFGSEDSGVGGFARGRFNGPRGLSVGANGVVYVADTGSSLIRTIGTNGTVGTVTMPATFIATFGDLNNPRAVLAITDGSSAWDTSLSNRFGGGFTSSTNLYVADTANNRIVWLQWSNTAWAARHFAGDSFPTFAFGTTDGVTTAARFAAPSGLTRDGYGNLYVADASNHRIRCVTPMGDVQTIAGSSIGNTHSDIGTTAQFAQPVGLAADRFGTLFVADSVNSSLRLVTPYQSNTPTNGMVTFFPFNGPTNSPLMGAAPVFFSRGLTNDVYGLEHAGADSRDSFVGIATSAETGTNGVLTNFLYVAGSAQFSTNSGAGLHLLDRMFISKLDTTGRPLWTRGHMPAAVIHAVTNGLGAITGLVLDSGGAGYSGVPVVTILDPLNPVMGLRQTAVTVTVAGGVVTGITAPVAPLAGPFIAPRVYVEPPISANVPANAVAAVNGTNVVAVGYTNVSSLPLTTNNRPFLMCLEATNGTLRWATNSTNSGHLNSVTAYGDRLIGVGAAYLAGNTLQSSNLLEMWSLSAGTQMLSLVTNFAGNTTSWLAQVVAIESLDRAYAVGSVLRADKKVDAVLLEIDLQTLAIVSSNLCNITNYDTGSAQSTNYGKGITTDGVDLYVAVEGPGDGNLSDRQSAVFRYRAKNFYQPEESLDVFVGDRTWATNLYYTNILGVPTNTIQTNQAWRLQIADTRAGGTNAAFPTNGAVISWSLNFSYAAPGTAALAVTPGATNQAVLLSATPQVFRVQVPPAASQVTNLVTASAPVRVTFHPFHAPVDGGADTKVMFSGASFGSFIVSTNAASAARLRPGSDYYLAVTPLAAQGNTTVEVSVGFDRTELPPVVTLLASGTPVNGLAVANGPMANYSFVVPANASGAMFEITAADGDVDLYLRRSNGTASLPSVSAFDHLSANPGSGVEQIFLVTNGAAAGALTPGTWFIGVRNADNAPVAFTVRATAGTGTPYTVVPAADGQLLGGVTSPGNAPSTMFRLNVPAAQKALLFELRGLTGPGDLIVRRNTFPLATSFDAANARPGMLPELVTVRTNGTLPSVVGDWYFGVVNPGTRHIGYTVMARQPTNGVLLGSGPIQIVRPPGTGLLPGGGSFGFDLDVVPGEIYQVQYATNAAATNWLVLTNIVAPPGGAINFLHSGALTNRNLYYRIRVVAP